jgi:hypothetical protein
MRKLFKKLFKKKRQNFQQGDIIEIINKGHRQAIIMVHNWRYLDIYSFTGTLLEDNTFYKAGHYGSWDKPFYKEKKIKLFEGKITIEKRITIN